MGLLMNLKIFGYPALINHADYTQVIGEAGAIVLGKDQVLTIKPVMGAEEIFLIT